MKTADNNKKRARRRGSVRANALRNLDSLRDTMRGPDARDPGSCRAPAEEDDVEKIFDASRVWGKDLGRSEERKDADIVPDTKSNQNLWPTDLDTAGIESDDRLQIPESEADLDLMFGDIASVRESFRKRLMQAAIGQRRLTSLDIEDLLAKHLLELDSQASTMAETTELLYDMAFGPTWNKKVNSSDVLDVIEKLNRMHSTRLSDLRSTARLLAQIKRPSQVEVVAARPVRRKVRQIV